ncbi:MAG TPA: NifB/NifX family molybdenum-iron cluster-binding protein [Anaerolineales bacterium]|nr:NifB/NifX family molybdenum-iron cluster-binding protein [Anaerolineales bacterium]
MKLAITVNTPQFEASLERRFGRCAYFLIVDAETRAWESLPNPAADARGGAGTQAAQFLASQGVDAVVSGDFGPNAFTALDAAGIRMYSAQKGLAETLVDDFLAENLKRVTGSTGPQRHGGQRSQGGRRR